MAVTARALRGSATEFSDAQARIIDEGTTFTLWVPLASDQTG